MAGPKRSWNSHQLRLRALPHFARMRREEPFRDADKAEWQAAADRIAGSPGWYSIAGTHADWGCKRIHFTTPAEAKAMQGWISESGIETRPAPGAYRGPQLSVTGDEPS